MARREAARFSASTTLVAVVLLCEGRDCDAVAVGAVGFREPVECRPPRGAARCSVVGRFWRKAMLQNRTATMTMTRAPKMIGPGLTLSSAYE